MEVVALVTHSFWGAMEAVKVGLRIEPQPRGGRQEGVHQRELLKEMSEKD